MSLNNQTEKFIKDLEDMLLQRQKRAKVLQEELEQERAEIGKMVEALKILSQDPTTYQESKKTELRTIDLDFPGYPKEGSLIDKIKYFENMDMRMWRKKDMENMLIKAEGEKGEVIAKHLSSKLHYYTRHGHLINMRYNNSNLYSFYTTNRDWVEQARNGQHKVREGHEPKGIYTQKLSEEQRDIKNITWEGIE